jgi:hypothetical protein
LGILCLGKRATVEGPARFLITQVVTDFKRVTSALGQKQTLLGVKPMSALPPEAKAFAWRT